MFDSIYKTDKNVESEEESVRKKNSLEYQQPEGDSIYQDIENVELSHNKKQLTISDKNISHEEGYDSDRESTQQIIEINDNV